jgi:hypothetical protein
MRASGPTAAQSQRRPAGQCLPGAFVKDMNPPTEAAFKLADQQPKQ